jgi:hypothetical protein
VELAGGATNRNKLFLIRGVALERMRAQMEELLKAQK